MRTPLRYFEYDRVAWKGKWKTTSFTKDHYMAFENYYAQNPETPLFELIPYGVRFKQYVGAIQIGKTTIEVLPKVGRDGSEEQWQGILLEMLKTCSLLTAREVGEAELKLKSNSILELYFELYLNEVEQLCRRGLIKKYIPNSGQQKALRGALDFPTHLSKNIIHKERFYTKHTIYTTNHFIHQILNEGLIVIDKLSTSSLLRDRIERLKIIFPEVNRLKVQVAHFKKIEENRKHQPYIKALRIAELILLNYRPDIKSGRRDLLAIMFDMNRLWEEYIYRIIRKNHSDEFEVRANRSKVFWGKSQKIRPDLILTSKKDTDKIYIVDTKWKVVKNSRPSDDDLKQMYVYNHYWESYHSLLLYPKSENQVDVGNYYVKKMNSKDHKCQLGFAQVLIDGKLNPNLSYEIIEKFSNI